MIKCCFDHKIAFNHLVINYKEVGSDGEKSY